MTKEEFIEKARSVHGFKYSYPELPQKVTTETQINVSYNDEIYTQRVNKHLMGRCPEKNTPSKTTEQFVSEARKVWGTKYDYSLVEYKGALKKVKIIHDGIVYEQVAVQHLKAAPELKMNKEAFIIKSVRKWGAKYDYSLVEYKDCKTKVKIIHNETGKIYEQKPESHLRSAPEYLTKRLTKDEFIAKSNKKHNNKYRYTKSEYTLHKDKVIVTCPIHGDFKQVANSHLMGMGCKKCGDENRNRIFKPKYTTEDFIKIARQVWQNKYDYSLVEYKNAKTKIKIIYDGIVYEQYPSGHLKYPPERFLNQEIFLIKAKRKWGEKYDYSLVEFKTTHHPIKIIYQGIIYEQLPNNHLNYAPERRNVRTLETFIQDSKVIHNNKYSYDKTEYLTDRHAVIITCPFHGDFKQRPGVHLRGSGCKRCSESFGEKKIAKVLEDMGVEFNREHMFKDLKVISYLKFDFFLPSLRTCIEFDGIQHYEPLEFFGGIKAYELLKERDLLKESYCEDNYIDLIRIRYDQINKIEDILWNALKVKLVFRCSEKSIKNYKTL
jgi:very-short-patch-repair endonuclease